MIKHGMSYQEYQAVPGLRWSQLKHIAESPKHCRWAMDYPDTRSTPAQERLRAIHAYVLEPHAFIRQYAPPFEGYRKGKKWEAYRTKHEGKEILRQADHDEVVAVGDAIRDQRHVRDLLRTGFGESVITWTDSGTQVRCKARLDWFCPDRGVLVDLKGMGTIRRLMASLVAKHQWDGQLAFYREGLRANGVDVEDTYLIAYEAGPPYDVAVCELSDAAPDGFLHLGAQRVRELLQLYRDCEKTGVWPGRELDIFELDPPEWRIPEFEFQGEE